MYRVLTLAEVLSEIESVCIVSEGLHPNVSVQLNTHSSDAVLSIIIALVRL